MLHLFLIIPLKNKYACKPFDAIVARFNLNYYTFYN